MVGKTMRCIRRSDSQCIKKLILAVFFILALMGLFGCSSKKNSFSANENSPVMDFRFPEVKKRYYNDALPLSCL